MIVLSRIYQKFVPFLILKSYTITTAMLIFDEHLNFYSSRSITQQYRYALLNIVIREDINENVTDRVCVRVTC